MPASVSSWTRPRISRHSVWKLPPGASVRKKKGRRNRKKRRKRRTLRSPRPLLRARARRRQRQWHVSGFPFDVSPRAVFPSVDDRPKMLDIMAGMEQKNSYVLLFSAPRTVFPPLSSGPRCSASWPVWTRRISACARLGLLVVDDVPRAVLLLVVSSPRCPLSWPAWTTGQLSGGSQVQLLDEVVVPVVCNDICLGPAAHSGGAAGAAHHRGFFMLSPYSTLSLVRQRIHVLHFSTELLEGSPFSVFCLVQQWIQVYASYEGWFC